MTHSVIDVTNGPGKDDLLRAVTNTDALLTTIFDTPAGAVEAQINRIEERGDEGVDFMLGGAARVVIAERCLLHGVVQLRKPYGSAGVEGNHWVLALTRHVWP
jgi:hypothetical protein